MRVVPIPCLEDNYAYLVICEATGTAAVVDPSESAPVLAAVQREGVELRAVWNTHHHWDHTGGNEALAAAVPGLEVVAHAGDRGRVKAQTRAVDDGDEVTLGTEVRATIIHNPGHTSGAISYHLAKDRALFTGDTLFGAGCGRLFEGPPAQMHASLSRLAALPEETRVYCGHEYTANNLRFAAAVEPDNAAIADRRARVDRLRQQDAPSVPFSIADELATNPFLRTDQRAVIDAARARAEGGATDESPVEVFAALRRWKDRF